MIEQVRVRVSIQAAMTTVGKYTCGHCDTKLSKTAFYKHKKLYYDRAKRMWRKTLEHPPPDVDFDFGSDKESDFFSDSDSSSGSGRPPSDREQNEADYQVIEDFVRVDEPPDCNFEQDNSSRTEILLGNDEDDSDGSPREATQYATIVIGYIKFIFLWQYSFKVSDVGISRLFAFFAGFLVMLSRVLKLKALEEFSQQLPLTVSKARLILKQRIDPFEKYNCCSSCCEIYQTDQTEKPRGYEQCTYVAFPNHTQAWHRKPCGAELMKSVKTSSGTTYFKPRKVYCYNSIISSLQELLLRPGFFRHCEEWRDRQADCNVLSDVYDGTVWKKFMSVDNIPFLSLPYNFAFSLNVDWFQPFKHTQHSVGVLYVAIQNLPRRLRFLQENIIIVGIIPGPHEPSKNINSFLRPFVNELKKLWTGVPLKSARDETVLVRAALICVACDIPAARKVCGFVGHRALRGCSKCLKTFPTDTFGQKADYTGFDRNTWTLRDAVSHREHATRHQKAKTLSVQVDLERNYGCRYSVLLELPYFDPIASCIVDPMHNLLLGTAKHMVSVWKEKGQFGKKKASSVSPHTHSAATK